MIKSLKLLLKYQLKNPVKTKNLGFTLIELLVGLILAVLIITPMLTFMVNLLDTDNKEQAKTSTEQEISASIDYINKDLQQAFYIYGPVSTTDARPAIYAQLPSVQPTTGCSNTSECTPIIAFWKKKFMENSIPIVSGTNCSTANVVCHDTYVDSLVVYYRITETNPTTWSKSGRIARFEIQEGVKGFTGSYVSPNDSTTGRPTSGSATSTSRDLGFQTYSIAGEGTTDEKMNLWTKKTGENYTTPVTVLVDNIESFTFTRNADNSGTIAITGNALARLNSNPPACTNDSIYCPKATLRVKNLGFLNTTNNN